MNRRYPPGELPSGPKPSVWRFVSHGEKGNTHLADARGCDRLLSEKERDRTTWTHCVRVPRLITLLPQGSNDNTNALTHHQERERAVPDCRRNRPPRCSLVGATLSGSES